LNEASNQLNVSRFVYRMPTTIMADKIPNNDASGIPAGTSIVSGLTPSASDPGPVMSSSGNNIILSNPLSTQNQAINGNQQASTTVTPSLPPINTLQNVTGNRFSDTLNSHSSHR
jgi:hypothetical protein